MAQGRPAAGCIGAYFPSIRSAAAAACVCEVDRSVKSRAATRPGGGLHLTQRDACSRVPGLPLVDTHRRNGNTKAAESDRM